MITLIHEGERYMIVNLSGDAANVSLDAIASMMANASLELLEASGNVLAVLKFSNPAAAPAVSGEIEFHEIREGVATTNGKPTTGRIVAASGTEIMTVDVGDESSDAVIRLNTTSISRGSPVRIGSFKLAMP